MATGISATPQLAFYYPGHLWRHSDWIKTLLLFFDGVGLLIPEYKMHEAERVAPELAGPMKDLGLIHYLVADKMVDSAATKQLTNAVGGIIASGVLDKLFTEHTAFHEISMSRMGFYGDETLAVDLFKSLKSRGLARDSEDGVSIPLHPLIRNLILVLLAQILKSKGAPLGFELSPATDQTRVVRALTELLDLPSIPSSGNVVEFDLQSVSVDLTKMPLDEILDFRAQHGKEHRAYARSAKLFAEELSRLPVNEREQRFLGRQQELNDLANDLRNTSRKAWKRPASFALSLAGAAWTYHQGDYLGALLSAAPVALTGIGDNNVDAGAFSYLFSAQREFY